MSRLIKGGPQVLQKWGWKKWVLERWIVCYQIKETVAYIQNSMNILRKRVQAKLPLSL